MMFSPASIWNAPLANDAPIDTESALIVEALAGMTPHWINTVEWSVPVVEAHMSQPLVRVNQSNGGKTDAALQAAWEAVPLPRWAKPAAGTDKTLVVYQASSEKLWEFWGLRWENGAWWAAWGGAIDNVSADPGVYGPEAWPGATDYWGASASSLSIAGGLVRLWEWEAKRVSHALAMALPNVRKGVHALPAKRDDGRVTTLGSVPEGAHLRLDPALDLTELGLPAVTLMLAEAAQKYGIVVRDYAASPCLYGQDPSMLASNPYLGPWGYFEGLTPAEILKPFPWGSLQVLEMELV